VIEREKDAFACIERHQAFALAPVPMAWKMCSIRHRMPFDSRNEGATCVSMMWRAISGRPYLHRHAGRVPHSEGLRGVEGASAHFNLRQAVALRFGVVDGDEAVVGYTPRAEHGRVDSRYLANWRGSRLIGRSLRKSTRPGSEHDLPSGWMLRLTGDE